jgi:hypothetical protein
MANSFIAIIHWLYSYGDSSGLPADGRSPDSLFIPGIGNQISTNVGIQKYFETKEFSTNIFPLIVRC